MSVFKYKFPELGEGLHEGEIVKWHIKAGDAIEEDQIIMEVQNDKAVVEVPAPVTGKVIELKVEEGTVSVVGDVVATFEVEGEVEEEENEQEESREEPEKVRKEELKEENDAEAVQKTGDDKVADSKDDKSQASGSQGKVLATPSVRKLAREKDVPLDQVKATGKNGRITRDDVLSFDGSAAQKEPAKQEDHADKDGKAADKAPAAKKAAAGNREEERVPMKGIRKVIANAMVKSVYTAPHVTIMDEVDVTKLVELREKAKPMAEKKGVKLTYLPFIVKALVAAAREFPVLNASIDDEKNEIVYKKYFNVGIAADTENGLVVPVVDDADRKNIWKIAAEIKDLAVRARDGKLAPDEMKGGTITITNIGSAGGMFFTPVINHPEVAILGTGRISEKPVVRNGEITVGKVMALSFSFDHRIIDGATAQYAVNLIKQLLEDPQLFVMEV
jgi:pyruvate dehydrogenase E2 component (dihydrolipoamide acetyltransferase)